MSASNPQFWRHPAVHYSVSVIIFIAFIAAVEHFQGWRQILMPWQAQSWAIIGTTICLALLTLLLRAARVFDYFRLQVQGRFIHCFKLVIQHNLYNNLLPMRAGELSFPILMSRYFGIKATQSMPVLLWFRILDLHTILTLGLLAAGSQWLPASLLVCALALWLPLPLLLLKANSWLNGFLAKPGRNRLLTLLADASRHLPQHGQSIWRSWTWTWANWLVKLGVFAWIITLFIPASLFTALTGAITGDLTSVLPIHGIAGTGTYEAGVMSGLLLFGIPTAQALLAAVNLHLFLLASTLISGALSFFLPATSSNKPPLGA